MTATGPTDIDVRESGDGWSHVVGRTNDADWTGSRGFGGVKVNPDVHGALANHLTSGGIHLRGGTWLIAATPAP